MKDKETIFAASASNLADLQSVQVSTIEFNDEGTPRVIVTTKDNKKYGIYWEDDNTDHSVVVYNILLEAISNQALRISGKYEPGKSQSTLTGMIRTLTLTA
ncbi:hypothetical protein [Photorhabdus temperata]|uniref:hypothetical protein n=1 Tax=Photorhabdus temperata TaxID=574560 RepID=UPI000427FD18|nr:hypothetical protein [Photorhabdus temperata]